MLKSVLLAAGLAFGLSQAAFAAAEKYTLDPSHSQIVFEYNHLGYSNTTGIYSGFNGTIDFDAADPKASSVAVTVKTDTLDTGWEERTKHFLSGDFFNAAAHPEITFKSTGIEVTGDKTGKITGDLTINGVTKSIVLDAALNQQGEHPMAKKPWIGFEATTTVKRTDFNMGAFAPYVSDEVKVHISIEAQKAE